jgi:hypothetical protein
VILQWFWTLGLCSQYLQLCFKLATLVYKRLDPALELLAHFNLFLHRSLELLSFVLFRRQLLAQPLDALKISWINYLVIACSDCLLLILLYFALEILNVKLQLLLNANMNAHLRLQFLHQSFIVLLRVRRRAEGARRVGEKGVRTGFGLNVDKDFERGADVVEDEVWVFVEESALLIFIAAFSVLGDLP